MSHPEIVAHRGASRERPENTLAAFARAVELGADAAELDVHRTRDGVIVVHHDPDIKDAGPIRELTAAQVGKLVFRGEPIPTLAQVFAAVGDKLRLYVELKGRDCVPGTIELIRAERAAKLGREDRSAVHCFDHRLIRQAAVADATVARGVLEGSYPVDHTHAAKSVDARDLWRHRDFIDAEFVQAAHAEGRRVVAWTVNDPGLMKHFAAWGVDAICTDDVALARSTLGG